MCLFLVLSWVGLQCLIVAFTCHTHLLLNMIVALKVRQFFFDFKNFAGHTNGKSLIRLWHSFGGVILAINQLKER